MMPQSLTASFAPLARAAFWLASAFALVMAWLPKPPRLPTGLWGDKIEHIIAFAVLAALASAGYRDAARLRLIGGLSAFGLLIEAGQMIPALNRDADVRDWIADTVAVILVVGVAALLGRRRQAAAPAR